MGHQPILVGDRYRNFIVQKNDVVRFSGSGRKIRFYEVRCDCGYVSEIDRYRLTKHPSHTCRKCRHLVVASKNRARYLKGDEASARQLVQRYRDTAKRRGIVFELDLQEAISMMRLECCYCGAPPSNQYLRSYRSRLLPRAEEHRTPFTYSGLDRVNSTLGYVKHNVVSCCSACNRAKSDMPYPQFEAWLRRIAARWASPS